MPAYHYSENGRKERAFEIKHSLQKQKEKRKEGEGTGCGEHSTLGKMALDETNSP